MNYRVGLIPAHAGKTAWWVPSSLCSWAHPRSRGENEPADQVLARAVGSSPLTRGKLHLGREASAGHGLIPAHAGKTRRERPRPISVRAHPRSRGENLSRPMWTWVRPGSSPLTRGKPSPEGESD